MQQYTKVFLNYESKLRRINYFCAFLYSFIFLFGISKKDEDTRKSHFYFPLSFYLCRFIGIERPPSPLSFSFIFFNPRKSKGRKVKN